VELFATAVSRISLKRKGCGDNGGANLGGEPQGSVGARLWYLPPYSPDLNPIEQAFTKIKHWMRTAQKRTVEDTWRYIGSLLATIPPSECNNYFHQRRIRFRQSVKRLASWDLGSDGAFECTRPAIVALNEGTDGRASKSQRR